MKCFELNAATCCNSRCWCCCTTSFPFFWLSIFDEHCLSIWLPRSVWQLRLSMRDHLRLILYATCSLVNFGLFRVEVFKLHGSLYLRCNLLWWTATLNCAVSVTCFCESHIGESGAGTEGSVLSGRQAFKSRFVEHSFDSFRFGKKDTLCSFGFSFLRHVWTGVGLLHQ